MLRKNVKSLLEQFQVCIFAEIVFGVRCTLNLIVRKMDDAIRRFTLYNNQVNARALNGQSAMVYCAGKLMEKSRVF